MIENKSTTKFSKRFLWGASTSAHQVEGGNHNQWTVWELENAKVRSAQSEYNYGDFVNWVQIKSLTKNPSNFVSDKLADHYNNYSDDFAFLKKMHMNAYRFSVEWSRIESEEGVFDFKEINHYKDYIKSLDDLGIEPILTLFHFSLPVWFAEKGGFLKRSNVKYFVRFAEKIVKELGSSVKYIITINEPEVYVVASYKNLEWPPMISDNLAVIRVINNLAYAHKKTVKTIKSINRRYRLSIAKNSSYFYPGDDSFLSKVSANVMQYFSDDYIIKKFIKNCDFLGVNYYNSNRVLGYRVHNPDKKVSDLGWDMQPSDIQYVLERLHQKYNMQILITENGLADAEDKNRQWWIKETLVGIQNAMKNGVQVMGYLHWSLIDNFEWAHGKWPRFGLVEINYSTGERKLRPSATWFGRIIKKLRDI